MFGMGLMGWLAFSDHQIPKALESITVGLGTGTVGGQLSAVRNGVAKPLRRSSGAVDGP